MSDYDKAINIIDKQIKDIADLKATIRELKHTITLLKNSNRKQQLKLNHILDYAHKNLDINEEHQIKRIYGLKKGKDING